MLLATIAGAVLAEEFKPGVRHLCVPNADRSGWECSVLDDAKTTKTSGPKDSVPVAAEPTPVEVPIATDSANAQAATTQVETAELTSDDVASPPPPPFLAHPDLQRRFNSYNGPVNPRTAQLPGAAASSAPSSTASAAATTAVADEVPPATANTSELTAETQADAALAKPSASTAPAHVDEPGTAIAAPAATTAAADSGTVALAEPAAAVPVETLADAIAEPTSEANVSATDAANARAAAAAPVAPVIAATVAPTQAKAVTAPLTLAALQGARAFATLPASHYTLQLAQAATATDFPRLIGALGLDRNDCYLLRVDRDGGDWWVLVYGVFIDANSARIAASQLPVAAGMSAVWPRRVGYLQGEYRPANH